MCFLETACRRRNVNATIIEQIMSKLKYRLVHMTTGHDKIHVKFGLGTPQSGVLPPLLWNIVVDDLILLMWSEMS